VTQNAATPDVETISIRYSNDVVSSRNSVLDLDVIRPDMPTNLALEVTNKTSSKVFLAISSSEDVMASWVGRDAKGLPSQTTIEPLGKENISVQIRPVHIRRAGQPRPNSYLALHTHGRLIALVEITDHEGPARFIRKSTDRFYSSSRSAVGVGSLCTGKRPPGYVLDCSSVQFAATAVGAAHNWSCGGDLLCTFQTCTPDIGSDSTEDKGLCVSLGTKKTDQVLTFDATLTAAFEVGSPHGKLLAQGSAIEQVKQIDDTAACLTAWNAFIESHKSLPIFQPVEQTLKIVPPIPTPANPVVTWRDYPCAALQSTTMGPPAAYGPGWQDLKWSGIRLETKGGLVLLGIVPSDMTYTSLGVDLNGGDIRILRDANFVVGEWSSTLSQPGLGSGITVGTSYFAIDTPPPGLHIYSVQVIKSGSNGRFVAYELAPLKGGLR
jgi:hypothetical protein